MALSLLFLGACQDPNSTLLDHPAIVVDFSATQNEGVEKGLIASGEAVLTNGVSQSTAPFVRSASGEWQVSSIAPVSFPATLTIRLFSGADRTGWLLFQGTRVLSEPSNAPEGIPVANVTYRKERFGGVVGTVNRTEIVPIAENSTAVFTYQVEVALEFVIAVGDYTEFQIETRSDTHAQTKFTISTGTVDRQSLNYTFHKLTEYNTDGDPVSPIPNPTFSMTLDGSGGFLASTNASDPHLVRQ